MVYPGHTDTTTQDFLFDYPEAKNGQAEICPEITTRINHIENIINEMPMFWHPPEEIPLFDNDTDAVIIKLEDDTHVIEKSSNYHRELTLSRNVQIRKKIISWGYLDDLPRYTKKQEKTMPNKDRDMRIGKQMTLIMQIKQKAGPGDTGTHQCTCGKKLSYAIAGNGHIRISCSHCKLVAIE